MPTSKHPEKRGKGKNKGKKKKKKKKRKGDAGGSAVYSKHNCIQVVARDYGREGKKRKRKDGVRIKGEKRARATSFDISLLSKCYFPLQTGGRGKERKKKKKVPYQLLGGGKKLRGKRKKGKKNVYTALLRTFALLKVVGEERGKKI